MSTRFYVSPVADGVPFDNTGNGFSSDTVQDAIVEARNSAIGNLVRFPFITSGNVSNKWLGFANSTAPSNEVPFIVPQNSDLKGLTFSNRDNNVDIDVQIYKNGVLVYTWQVRNKRVAWNVGLSGVSFSQGDRISCFVSKVTGGSGDDTPQDPIIDVLIKFLSESAASDGRQNGA